MELDNPSMIIILIIIGLFMICKLILVNYYRENFRNNHDFSQNSGNNHAKFLISKIAITHTKFLQAVDHLPPSPKIRESDEEVGAFTANYHYLHRLRPRQAER